MLGSLFFLISLAGFGQAAGCVQDIASPARIPPEVYAVSNIIQSSECLPFAKHLNAYGLLLLGKTNAQDNALQWMAKTITEMFPASAPDQARQKKVLQAMYSYRAAMPVFEGVMDREMSPARDVLSVCDTIKVRMTDGGNPISPKNQVIEVMEHLLHIITDVGLAEAFPSQWGLSSSSDLWRAMEEAKAAGVYDDSSYNQVPEAVARTRLKLQEFAYWCLSTVWGVHAEYFDGSAAPEWTLVTASEVQTKLPLFWKLHQDTTATIMSGPSSATLQSLGKLAVGQTPQPVTWPLVVPGRRSPLPTYVSACETGPWPFVKSPTASPTSAPTKDSAPGGPTNIPPTNAAPTYAPPTSPTQPGGDGKSDGSSIASAASSLASALVAFYLPAFVQGVQWNAV